MSLNIKSNISHKLNIQPTLCFVEAVLAKILLSVFSGAEYGAELAFGEL
jgi:hypothetical protein